MNKALPYLIFYGITFFIFFGMHFYVYVCLNRFFVFSRPKTMIAACAVLALAFPVCSILERFFTNGFNSALYAGASVWLGVLFLLLTACLMYEPLRLLVKLDSNSTGWILLSCVVLVSLYALVNAFFITVKTVEIPLAGLKAPVKMVQLSDIHVGTIHNTGFLTRAVEKTNALEPDMVVITGDFFDGIGPVSEKTVSPLRNIRARTFLVTGNHESYGDLERIAEFMAAAGVTMLRNTMVEYKGIRLVGADNPARDGQKDTPFLRDLRVAEGIPSVLLYHQPAGIEHAVRAGIDLQVSGHTHNGQIVPFNLLARMLYKYLKGLYLIDGMYLYVSPGTGTWGPPMRLGSHNEVTLLNLVPRTACDSESIE